MSTADIWQLTATELASRIRNGTATAAEATEAALARMDAVNPDLNAVVVPLHDAARERAAALDRAVADGGTPGPLHGVPVTIKINVDQAGTANSNGLPALANFIADDDAPVVRNLLTAGAVIIGRTNTPEFSFRADTENPLFGQTWNPWGRHVSPGGSSGGAGSSVMAGIGALAHGNDIGGSLRFPAVANGAVTIKPGVGRVPAWNPSQKTERGMLAQNMSTQGLITRTAADLHLGMPVMIAPDPRDPFHVPLPWRGYDMTRPLRVAFTRETFGFDLHPEVDAALTRAAEALEAAGYQVEEVTPPLVREAGEDGYRTLMGEVLATFGADIEAAGSDNIKGVFAEYFRQFPPHSGDELLQGMARRSHYARQWSIFQQDYPLTLCPFQPMPFFRPGRDLEGAEGVREALGTGLWSYSMNFMGLPAGTVPTHVAQLPQGPQPMSVQIVGRRWREDLVVDALQAVEDACGPMAPDLWHRMG